MNTRSDLPIWRLAIPTGLMCLCTLGFNPAAAAASSVTQATDAHLEVLLASYAWLQATLQGDFAAQAVFHPERMEAFYLWRNVPKLAVMAEKRRVFEQARTVDIEIES